MPFNPLSLLSFQQLCPRSEVAWWLWFVISLWVLCGRLNKLGEMVKDKEAGHAAIHGVAKSRT